MNPAGGLMGLPASDRKVDMRVVDMYRRDGDKLVENWIFIDILYFLMQQDVDVLERTSRILRH
jgi:predicted ester cyclase